MAGMVGADRKGSLTHRGLPCRGGRQIFTWKWINPPTGELIDVCAHKGKPRSGFGRDILVEAGSFARPDF